jgi:hypothetical protein
MLSDDSTVNNFSANTRFDLFKENPGKRLLQQRKADILLHHFNFFIFIYPRAH